MITARSLRTTLRGALSSTPLLRACLAIGIGVVLILWPGRSLAFTVGLVGLAFVITGLLEAFEALNEDTFARVIRGLLSAALGGGLILVGQWSTELLLVAVALLLLVRAGFDAYHALLGWRSGDEFWWAALRAAGLVLAAATLLVVGEVAVLVTIIGIGTAWVITGGVYLWQVFGPGASARQEADILDTPRTIGAWLQRRVLGETAHHVRSRPESSQPACLSIPLHLLLAHPCSSPSGVAGVDRVGQGRRTQGRLGRPPGGQAAAAQSQLT